MGNKEKFKQIVLYISNKSQTDEAFGATKLNKILFYSDFGAYSEFGESITKEKYQKLEGGPGPVQLLPIREELEAEGKLTVKEKQYHGKTQERPIALEKADLSLFTAQEIAKVDEVIEKLWNKNATETSEYSHRFVGWKLAGEEKEIPYETALVNWNPDPTPSEIKHAEDLAGKYLQ